MTPNYAKPIGSVKGERRHRDTCKNLEANSKVSKQPRALNLRKRPSKVGLTTESSNLYQQPMTQVRSSKVQTPKKIVNQRPVTSHKASQ